MLGGSGLGAYLCDGAFHGDIYLRCGWQLLQRLILKCAEVGGTDRWVPRQLIFIQRAWSLPGATCDLRHCLSLCDACILFPERSPPCPWLVSMVRGRVGLWPPQLFILWSVNSPHLCQRLACGCRALFSW